MNSPINEMELIETTNLNKYSDIELRALKNSPRFAVPWERP
jgi:hypothetical protein